MRTSFLSCLVGLVILAAPLSSLQADNAAFSAPAFPQIGAEYALGSERKVLPESVCGDGHILFLEHGTGPWYLVAFVYPKRYNFSPTRIGTAWINIDKVNYFEEVGERNRRVPDPRR